MSNKIGFRLLAPLVAVLMIGLGSTYWLNRNALIQEDQAYNALIENDAKGTLLLSRTNTALMEVQALAYRLLFETDGIQRGRLRNELEAAVKLAETRLQEANPLLSKVEGVSAAIGNLRIMRENLTHLLKIASENDEAQLPDARRSFDKSVADVRLGIRKLLNDATKSWDDDAARLRAQGQETLKTSMVVTLVTLFTSIALVGWLINRIISRPLNRLTNTMQSLASDDLLVEIQGRERSDEIGAMARAVEVFKETGLARRELQQQADIEAEKQAKRQIDIEIAIGQFERKMSSIVENVTDASRGVTDSAKGMTVVSQDTSHVAITVRRLRKKHPPTCNPWRPRQMSLLLPSRRFLARCAIRQPSHRPRYRMPRLLIARSIRSQPRPRRSEA